MQWAHHLLSKEDLRKRAEHLQNLPRKTPKGQGKKRQLKPPTRPPRLRYGARTDSGTIALRAFWGMHVEAMNWSGMGHAEYAAALGLSPHSLRIWRDRLEESGDEMDWRSLLHPSARAQLSSAANCTRRKYRLTPEAVDGRSNRRRFSDEQKRAMVQETEKPGVSVAEVCRRHGIATSLLFRWRVQFGLTARKAPQLATAALAGGATNEVPALTALRDLVQPPEGMTMIELEDGRRVFAPAGSSPAEVKRQFAGKEKAS
jgi:transposase-like protein